MQVNNALLDAPRAGIDSSVLFALLPGQTMQAEQVSVCGLDDMLLAGVAVAGAEIDEVKGASRLAADGQRDDPDDAFEGQKQKGNQQANVLATGEDLRQNGDDERSPRRHCDGGKEKPSSD